MREARLIVAKHDNAGQPMGFIHLRLRHQIVDAYGGVTITEGQGAWRSPSGKVHMEPCVIYDVATHDDGATLRRIAECTIVGTDQEAFYFRNPDGNVEFINNVEMEIAA